MGKLNSCKTDASESDSKSASEISQATTRETSSQTGNSSQVRETSVQTSSSSKSVQKPPESLMKPLKVIVDNSNETSKNHLQTTKNGSGAVGGRTCNPQFTEIPADSTSSLTKWTVTFNQSTDGSPQLPVITSEENCQQNQSGTWTLSFSQLSNSSPLVAVSSNTDTSSVTWTITFTQTPISKQNLTKEASQAVTETSQSKVKTPAKVNHISHIPTLKLKSPGENSSQPKDKSSKNGLFNTRNSRIPVEASRRQQNEDRDLLLIDQLEREGTLIPRSYDEQNEDRDLLLKDHFVKEGTSIPRSCDQGEMCTSMLTSSYVKRPSMESPSRPKISENVKMSSRPVTSVRPAESSSQSNRNASRLPESSSQRLSPTKKPEYIPCNPKYILSPTKGIKINPFASEITSKSSSVADDLGSPPRYFSVESSLVNALEWSPESRRFMKMSSEETVSSADIELPPLGTPPISPYLLKSKKGDDFLKEIAEAMQEESSPIVDGSSIEEENFVLLEDISSTVEVSSSSVRAPKSTAQNGAIPKNSYPKNNSSSSKKDKSLKKEILAELRSINTDLTNESIAETEKKLAKMIKNAVPEMADGTATLLAKTSSTESYIMEEILKGIEMFAVSSDEESSLAAADSSSLPGERSSVGEDHLEVSSEISSAMEDYFQSGSSSKPTSSVKIDEKPLP